MFFYIVTTCYLLYNHLFINQMNVVHITTYKLHILLNNIMKQLKYKQILPNTTETYLDKSLRNSEVYTCLLWKPAATLHYTF